MRITIDKNKIKKTADSAARLLFYTPFDSLTNKSAFAVISIEKSLTSVSYIKTKGKTIKIKRKNNYKGNNYPTAEEFFSLINIIMRGISIKRTKIVLSIPKEWLIIKCTKIPESAKDNLSDVISYQMDNLTPFSSEDVFFDYEIIDTKDGMLHVAVYVLNKRFVKPYMAILNENGIELFSITLNSRSLINLCTMSVELRNQKNMIIVNKGEDKYELIGAQNGVLTSVIDLKTKNYQDAKSLITERLSESCKCILIYEDNKIDNGNELITPDEINVYDIRELSFSTDDALDYGINVCLGAVSLYSSTDKKNINLLNCGIQKKETYPLVFSILLTIMIFALLGFIEYIPLLKNEQTMNDLDKQISLLKPTVEKLADLRNSTAYIKNEITAYNKFIKQEVYPSEIIKELTAITPDDTWFVRLEIKEDYITIDSYAQNASAYIGTLEKSPLFKDVRFESTTVKDPRLQKDRFKIKAALENIPS
ncbi:fimbrial assembly family protein [Candidatus Magnetoovum chiemensis]|nr:fimbrial assembly family protein [Candidatus Magnetoovum chiemensis]